MAAGGRAWVLACPPTVTLPVVEKLLPETVSVYVPLVAPLRGLMLRGRSASAAACQQRTGEPAYDETVGSA